MNQITINATAANAIHAVATAAMHEERATLAALPVLRKAFEGCARDDVRDTIMVEYAHAIKVELKVQGSGRLVWPAGSDTAKRACNRFIARILADETDSARKAPLLVPEEIMALARALVEGCNEYEEASRLIATAIAQAKAGK